MKNAILLTILFLATNTSHAFFKFLRPKAKFLRCKVTVEYKKRDKGETIKAEIISRRYWRKPNRFSAYKCKNNLANRFVRQLDGYRAGRALQVIGQAGGASENEDVEKAGKVSTTAGSVMIMLARQKAAKIIDNHFSDIVIEQADRFHGDYKIPENEEDPVE